MSMSIIIIIFKPSLILASHFSSVIKSIDKINEQNLKQDFTLKNLEAQINASIGLNSAKEYKFWLITYARYLSDNRKLLFFFR